MIANLCSINDVFFGDHLSFLRALLGSETVYHKSLYVRNLAYQYGDDPSRMVTAYAEPEYFMAAKVLIGQPDEERIPWLYRHVFEEGS
jgi:hypothetical protein